MSCKILKYRVRYESLTVRYRVCRLQVIILMLNMLILFPLEAQQKATRQSALDAFNKGKYDLAYNHFNELLVTFPKDPVYRYYSGVCLVKMQKDPEEAVELLLQARRDGAVVRSVPQDALFWLGRAQQMAGRFTDAIASYDEYTLLAGRKTARDMGTPEFIQQCREKRGQLTLTDIITDRAEVEVKAEVKDKDKDKPETKAEKKTGTEIPVYRPSGPEKLNRKADSLATVTTPDTVKSEKARAVTKAEEVQDSTFSTVIDEHVAEAVKQPVSAGVLSLFSIDPEVIYDREAKIRINPKHPAGLIYRIQVAAFRNQVALSYFKGIVPVYGIRNVSTGVTTYYAGMFRKIDDARKALPQVRQTGFRDAFLVAFSGGRAVSLERAAVLEKEWGVIPFTSDEQIARESTADTIPPTLSFRVEVVRSSKPVSEQDYEDMKKLSGTRGLDIETLPDGSIVYLIGRFITFVSAENYAGLLVRNGYRDAKVVAWLGKKEIPVETAKQLFESLK